MTVVGSLNMDLVARAPRLPHPGETLAGRTFAQVAGGKGGNQAVAAARLGAQVSMLGCVGADSNGTQLRAGLEAEGIDCAALETGQAASGVALIIVDDASQNAIVIVAGSNGEVTPETVARHEAVLAAAEVVICQLETPPDAVHAALAAARRLGKTVILNPAPATGPLPADWLPLIDYLIPNELEAAALTGLPVDTPEDAARAAAALRSAGARNVLVTLGARGVEALLDGATDATLYEAPKVEAVDTTAAGDTFIGGFAAQLAQGASVEAAIRFAQRAAALSVTRAGAQPSIPTRAELDASG
ncbi:ribokinase [Paraburkholderia ginsengisoli]|uniref:Ribokinase n=2 Tax=Paraburkholderia ginsengisoli TaxID=311231 RepID=A0A7T4N571_9BURK|nr:ribokinase [Paraburkholderia ginsengisoli]QQC65471.1 ribokinase [Paraburkholderia ginsengisoli]